MITEKAKIAKNVSILITVDIFTRMMGAVLIIIIARKLGVASLGLLAFALSFGQFFSFFTRFGFKNLISRNVAREPGKTGSYFSSILFIKLISSFIILVVIVIIVHFLNYTQEKNWVVYLAVCVALLDSFIEFCNAFFRAHQKAEYEAFLRITCNLFSLTSGIVILFLGYGLVIIMVARFLVYLFSAFLGFGLIIKKIEKPIFNIHLDFCLQLIKMAIPFASLGIIVGFNIQMGTILLSFIKGDLETGLFTAAQKLCNVFGFIPAAFLGAVLPAMSKFSQNKLHVKLEQTFEGMVKYLLIIVLPIAIGISILANELIFSLYGEQYRQSVFLLRLLVWLLVFSFLNHAFMIAFVSLNNENKFVKFQIVGTLINFFMNISLIPVFGAVAVCFAMVFSQAAIFVLSIFSLSYKLSRVRIQYLFNKPMLAVLPISVFLVLFREQNLLIIIPVSILIYSIALFSLRTFSNDELSVIQEFFRWQRAKLVKK